jgi:hypothetical protein
LCLRGLTVANVAFVGFDVNNLWGTKGVLYVIWCRPLYLSFALLDEREPSPPAGNRPAVGGACQVDRYRRGAMEEPNALLVDPDPADRIPSERLLESGLEGLAELVAVPDTRSEDRLEVVEADEDLPTVPPL